MNKSETSFLDTWLGQIDATSPVDQTISITVQQTKTADPLADTVVQNPTTDKTPARNTSDPTVITPESKRQQPHSFNSWSQSAPTRSISGPLHPNQSNETDYKLGGELGVGGMGIVYAAEQNSLGRTVALKIRRPDKATTKEQDEMFVAEAAVTGLLEHPNIIPIYELGNDDTGKPFYTMKMVNGKSWDHYISKYTLEKNLEVLLSVANGLSCAHDQGIIHCDLKPANIMIGAHGEYLIVDWGLAVKRDKQDSQARPLSDRAQIGGTPAYMPPELAIVNTYNIGPQTDVYLLGSMLFFIITGKTPHTGEDLKECLINAANNIIAKHSETADQELLHIAHKCMADAPRDRFQSAEEFKKSLINYQQYSAALKLLKESELKFLNAKDNLIQFEKALFALEEAISLHPNIPGHQELNIKIRSGYALNALQQGNPRLCLSLLEHQQSFGEEIIIQAKEFIKKEHNKTIINHVGLALTLLTAILLPVILILFSTKNIAEQDKLKVAIKESSVARSNAERQSYLAIIAQAEAARRKHGNEKAQNLLNQCPTDQRKWEHRLLQHLTHGHRIVLPIKHSDIKQLCWSHQGDILFILDKTNTIKAYDVETAQIVKTVDGSKSSGPLILQSHADANLIIINNREIIVHRDFPLGEPTSIKLQYTIKTHTYKQGIAYISYNENDQLHKLNYNNKSINKIANIPNIDKAHFHDDYLYIQTQNTIIAINSQDNHSITNISKSNDKISNLNSDSAGPYWITTKKINGIKSEAKLHRLNGTYTSLNTALGIKPPRLKPSKNYGVHVSFANRSIGFIDTPSLRDKQQVHFHETIYSYAPHPSMALVAVSLGNSLHIIERPDNTYLKQIPVKNLPYCIHANDDNIYTIDSRSQIDRFDRHNNYEQTTVKPATGRWSALFESCHLTEITPHEILASNGRGVWTLNDSNNTTPLLSEQNNRISFTKCDLHPLKSMYAISPKYSPIQIWDIKSRKVVNNITLNDGRKTYIKTFAWSPAGTHIAAIDGARSIICLDIETNRETWRKKLDYRPTDLKTHKQWAIIAHGEALELFDWENGNSKPLKKHQNDITAFCINTKHNYLLSIDAEGWLVFWDLSTLQSTLSTRVCALTPTAIHSHGDFIHIAGQDLNIHSWHLAKEAQHE